MSTGMNVFAEHRRSHHHHAVCRLTPAELVRFIFLLLRDARSAKRGIATVSRLSICLSVCDVDVP